MEETYCIFPDGTTAWGKRDPNYIRYMDELWEGLVPTKGWIKPGYESLMTQ